jgi:Tol biopolymer transport system component
MQRLTLEGNNRFPIWSPDGASVAFQSDRAGEPGIYRQRVDGTGVAERLTSAAAGEVHVPESWSPDGRFISFAVRQAESHTLSTLKVATKVAVPLAGLKSLDQPNSVFSPDGRWIAYGFDPKGDLSSSERGLFVRPFPGTGGAYQAPRQLVDFHPVWAPGGGELLYVASASAGEMAAVRVSTSGGMTFGTPTRFPTTVTGDRLSPQLRAYDILPDGRFVGPLVDDQSRRAITEIRVVLNWTEELKARVR